MKRFLLFAMMCVCVSIGAWAAPVEWSYTVDGVTYTGKYDVTNDHVRIEVNQPGGLAVFINQTKDANPALGGIGAANNPTALRIEKPGGACELNEDDFNALNSSDVPALAHFTTMDLSKASVAEVSTLSGMSMSGLQYLRLPNDKTSADDVKAMASLNSNNSALKMVGAYDNTKAKKDGGNYAAVALYSWEANNVTSFINQMDIKTSGNPPTDVCEIRMAGEYGDKDLVSNGATGTPNFGYATSAVWDFTGAHFADCTIPATDAAYYNYDDPFCDGALVANTTSSNAFYYFHQYMKQVVDIKLPDNNMTNLPYQCLNDLGSSNKTGYVALYGQDAFDANKAEENCVPLETLVIPDCYTDLEEECGKWARIRHLVVGSNVKRIHGGAFLKCDFLEDLDFAAGLSNCYVGDRSFNECKSMKHIALSEGIVSIGNGGFWNSQHLESIRLPQSLINIGNNAFNNCLALNSITIPENVQKIGQNAFSLCPFTDIYLTTTDPAKIPTVWSAGISDPGNGFGSFDGKCSFNHGHIDGWEGIPDTPQKAMLEAMSWDEAVAWYYIHVNGIPVLHYPTQLKDAVRATISSTYEGTSSDGFGLPFRSDMFKRSNVEGADLGTVGEGKFTKDGWAQFMLMKETTSGPGSEIYQKEYDDVWYTMCFPFDLTDEQLAAAFNETFNIVDFSGVEVKEAEENNGKMKLILHFNNVAITDYKDTNDKHYKRVMNGNEAVREKDVTSGFSYNVYIDESGTQYHHVTTSNQLTNNKTKTFAPGSNMSDAQNNFDSNKEAYIIDGVLATAGHPYLIHPAIGVVAGQPKQRCTFAGIEWIGQSKWKETFDKNSRTIDLGEDLTAKTDSNYNHPGYAGYEGQKYTFIGNSKEYRDDAQGAIGDEPQVPEKPVVPVAPPMPTETLTVPTETVAEPTPLTAEEQELISKLTEGKNQYEPGPWKDVTEVITANWSDSSDPLVSNYKNKFYIYGPTLTSINSEYATNGNANEAGFNYCKTTFNKNINYASDYAAYLANQAAWNAYNANQAAWNAYNTYNPTTAQEQYEADLAEYNRLKEEHDTWVENAKKWLTYIPKNAYFLGRKTGQLPKFYRETADDPAPGQASTRSGGAWTQFTAIVIPNEAALNVIEMGISAKAQSKGFEMLFNEDFEGTYIDDEDEGVVTAIEEAKKAGADVKYVDIVVSINGQVVRRGSTSIEGLPKGMYIINGKKYFVK